MSHAELANQKERRINGSHTNYYLVVLTNGVVVEIEDIIEYFNTNFALGTVFKSLVRLCKLRQDLGKPGSTAEYEIGKVKYYCDRTHAIILKRNDLNRLDRLVYGFRDLVKSYHATDIETAVISIPQPKRLDPYQFVVTDFIRALEATDVEGDLFLNTFTIAQLQARRKPTIYSLSDEYLAASDSIRIVDLLK